MIKEAFEQKTERTREQAIEDVESGRFKEMPDNYTFLLYKNGDLFSNSVGEKNPAGCDIRNIELEWDSEKKQPIEGGVRGVVEYTREEDKKESTTVFLASYYNRQGNKYYESQNIKLGKNGPLIYSATKDGEGRMLMEYMRENKTSGPSHEIFYMPDGKKFVEIVWDGSNVRYLDGEGNIIEEQKWSGNAGGMERGKLISRRNGKGEDMSMETINASSEPWSPAILRGGGPELRRLHTEFLNEILRRRGIK